MTEEPRLRDILARLEVVEDLTKRIYRECYTTTPVTTAPRWRRAWRVLIGKE